MNSRGSGAGVKNGNHRKKSAPVPQSNSNAKIKDVARVAGVSVATVSYVLNETRKISPETQIRVRSAARELGYSPNAAARNLAIGRSHILGLIVSDIRNPFFPEITTAFQEAANASDMEVLMMNTNYDAFRTRSSINRLLGLQVPGVAILTSEIDRSIMDLLARKEICAVYMDLGKVNPYVSNIVIDYEQGICAALDHIRELGHTRIGFIGGTPTLLSAQRRRRIFAECAAKMEGIETRIVDSDFTVQGGYIAFSKLLGSFPATAIIAANDLMAIGAMHCGYDRKLTVPGDISIIGFDDINFAQFTQPSLTTVRIPRSELGKIAFQALWQMLSDPARLGSEYRVPTSLVVRDSTAAK